MDDLIGADFHQREAVRRLLGGERNGAITTSGNNTVEGFAIVPITGWGLVISEPLSQVVAPALTSMRPVFVILIIALVVVASVVSLGVQRERTPSKTCSSKPGK